MSLVNISKLRNYLDNKINVMLVGTHGVGKTEIIRQVFNGAGLKWRYFSAATMDPWVDFIGVPRAVEREGKTEVLKLVKPEDFEDDLVEAIFFDEFNRAPQKVTNAVMELIQFKSINGRVFKNLKVVWTAINPHDDDETYHVEKMDPAVMDRFQVKITIPNELDIGYFMGKYGVDSTPFVKWWEELPVEMKKDISPRRLDYAINIYNIMGELEDVLPVESNLDKLKTYIKNNDNDKVLKDILTKSPQELGEFFTLENTAKYWSLLMKNENRDVLTKVFDYLNHEYVAKEFEKSGGNKKLFDLIKSSKNSKMRNIDSAVVVFDSELPKDKGDKSTAFLTKQKRYVKIVDNNQGKILSELIKEYKNIYLMDIDLKNNTVKNRDSSVYSFTRFLTDDLLPKLSLDEMYGVSKEMVNLGVSDEVLDDLKKNVGLNTDDKEVANYLGQFYGVTRYILKRLCEIDSTNIVKLATTSSLKVNKNIWDELTDNVPHVLNKVLTEGLKKATTFIEVNTPSLQYGVELVKKVPASENTRNLDLFKKITEAKRVMDTYKKTYEEYTDPWSGDYKKKTQSEKMLMELLEDSNEDRTTIWDRFEFKKK